MQEVRNWGRQASHPIENGGPHLPGAPDSATMRGQQRPARHRPADVRAWTCHHVALWMGEQGWGWRQVSAYQERVCEVGMTGAALSQVDDALLQHDLRVRPPLPIQDSRGRVMSSAGAVAVGGEPLRQVRVHVPSSVSRTRLHAMLAGAHPAASEGDAESARTAVQRGPQRDEPLGAHRRRPDAGRTLQLGHAVHAEAHHAVALRV